MPPPQGESDSGDRRFRLLVGGGAALFVVLVTWLRFDYDLHAKLPPPIPKPAPADPSAVRNTDFVPAMYNEYLLKDAESFGIRPPDLVAMAETFAYELVEPKQELAPGELPFETRTLRVSLRAEPLTASTSRGQYTAEHLILRLENLTDKPLAYRVQTSPGLDQSSCLTKADLQHNAIALLPKEAIERTECIFREGQRLVIERVETLVLPEIGYHYVSRLYPAHIGLDQRTSRAHKVPGGEACTYIPEQGIRLGLQRNTVSWRDVIDFYARHRCETYLFPVGYRAFSKAGERPLPVSPRDVTPP